jgi:hypothetical protein
VWNPELAAQDADLFRAPGEAANQEQEKQAEQGDLSRRSVAAGSRFPAPTAV